MWSLLPSDWVLRRATAVESERTELVELVESLSATVLVKRYNDVEGTWYSLELNGVNVAGTEPSLLAVQQLQGNLPMLLSGKVGRVLHVGFGSGGTCWAVTRYPVEQIDVVEIAPEVLQASNTHFADINHGVLDHPKVNVVVNDGRNYLLATDVMYDAILSDSIHPLYAGNSTLYTREYFEMCKARLKPGGVTSMWLPIYSLDRGSLLRILRAFSDVFPQTVVWYDVSTPNEFTVVTGMVEPGPIEVMWERAAIPAVAQSLQIANVSAREHLMANLLLGPAEVQRLTADVPAFVDDFPYVEYTSGRLLARDLTWYDNLVMLFEARSVDSGFPDGTGDWDRASAYRDRRVREILEQLRDELKGAI
jgi:hypothetical protein